MSTDPGKMGRMMRFRKNYRRVEVPAVTKPKRTGLNVSQRNLLRFIQELPEDVVKEAEDKIVSATPEGIYPIFEGFYDPQSAAEALGWSYSTVSRYMYAYLRIIRREDETAREFWVRQRKADPKEAPLLIGKHLSRRAKLEVCTHPKTYR